jgi:hypothetical protein
VLGGLHIGSAVTLSRLDGIPGVRRADARSGRPCRPSRAPRRGAEQVFDAALHGGGGCHIAPVIEVPASALWLLAPALQASRGELARLLGALEQESFQP